MSLVSQGDSVSRSGDLSESVKALALWLNAITIFEQSHHRAGLAYTLHRVANYFNANGSLDSTFAYYGRALDAYRSAEDRAGEAEAAYDLGNVYDGVGRADSAFALFERSLLARRELADRSGEAKVLSAIGRAQLAYSRPEEALATFARALQIERELGNRAGEAESFNDLGAASRVLGRPDSALAHYIRALNLHRDQRNRPGEGVALNNIGLVEHEMGRPDSALAHYELALTIRRATGDKGGEATTLHNMGWVHHALGRPDSALSYYARALPLRREAQDRVGEAGTLHMIGLVHGDAGQSDSALAHYSGALRIRQEIGDRSGEAATLGNIGWVQHGLGRPDSALVYYARALSIHVAVGQRVGEAAMLRAMGVAQDELGLSDSALTYLASALRVSREVREPAREAETLRSTGDVLLRSRKAGSAEAAAAMFDSSAAVHARLRKRAGGDANAVSFSETGGETFAAWSRAWMRLAAQARQRGDTAAMRRAATFSLGAAERGRAQALRDLLDQSNAKTQRARVHTDTMPGADLSAETDLFLAALRADSTALLYYQVDGDSLRAWFLGATGSLGMLPAISMPQGKMSGLIATARAGLGTGDSAVRLRRGDTSAPHAASLPGAQRDLGGLNVSGVRMDSVAAAAALSALGDGVLPQALRDLLAPGTELVIVPHGVLGQIPFAALALAGDTLPLGIRNPLRYAPSLSALFSARSVRISGPHAKSTQRAVVVGDPEMPQVRGEGGNLYQLSALSGAAEEGAWVAHRLEVPLLTGRAASEETVRELLSGASIVHLATHGMAYGTEHRVRESYVALAASAKHDGLLTLGEILDDQSLRFTADLVVLSACQTGLGETRQSEGTVGLQRGLLAKGARSVLVSLWSVDDAATRILMERFYTHWLGDGARAPRRKAEALRMAQNDVRDNPMFRNPRYWAAFQIVGAE